MKTRSTRAAATSLLAAIALLAPLCGNAAAEQLKFKKLKLVNSWQPYSDDTGKPAGAIDGDGIVHLKGAMAQQAGGVNSLAFYLPAKLRPNRSIYVPVNLVDGAAGRLFISSTGIVYVDAAGDYASAQAFTSLEGVTFAKE